jgi:hypothetical protein
MAIITTGNHPKDLWPGIKAHFGGTYTEHPEECLEIFESQTSDKMYEERVQYTGLGLAPLKSQGASIGFDDEQQGYVSRLTNVVYALGAIVTREAIEDGQYESIATRLARCLAFSQRQTKENVGANIYNRAFTSGLGGDGVVLLSASHPEVGGNQSNLLSSAADFSEAALEDLLIQISDATDSRGLKISLTGQKLCGPTALQFEFERVVNSVLQSSTANNDINAQKSMGMLPQGIAINHYFSDSDAWFIRTDAQEGMIFQSRRAVEFSQDNDFDTENAKMKSSERFQFGWGDWRGLYGSAGS